MECAKVIQINSQQHSKLRLISRMVDTYSYNLTFVQSSLAYRDNSQILSKYSLNPLSRPCAFSFFYHLYVDAAAIFVHQVPCGNFNADILGESLIIPRPK